MSKRMNRVAWGLVGVLALALAVSLAVLIRSRPYLIARYKGRGADLYRAPLQGASLAGVDLQWAHLIGADLQGTDLREARLRGAQLCGADLEGANLADADLTEARVRGGACLWPGSDAPVRYTNLRGANLRGADLRGADLASHRLYVPRRRGHGGYHVTISAVHLTGARYDRHTRWPSGFDPEQHGAVRE